MADTKITGLAAATTVDLDNDLLEIVDVSDTSMDAGGTNKKVTPRQLGAVVAVKSVTMTGTQSTTVGNGSWADVTDGVNPLSIAYSLSNAANKVIMIATICAGCQPGTNATGFRLLADATPVGVGDAASSRIPVSAGWWESSNGEIMGTACASGLFAPGDTSAHTYKVQVACMTGGGGIAYVNRCHSDTNASYEMRGASTLTIMEVTLP